MHRWRRPNALFRRAVSWCCVLIGTSGFGVARADRVELLDGRVLDGRFATLPGVAIDPVEAANRPVSPSEPILMCDDELARTMVSKKRVRNVEEAVVDPGMERIRIPQRVPDGGRVVAGVGSILGTTPFDEYGRRVLTLATASGKLDVVQGITEITPRWTRVQGIQTEKPLQLDMRLATTSIPRDILERVIAKHVDPTSSDERLRVVRLLMQAGRYDDARATLDGVLASFPELADLAQERKTLGRLASRQLLDEILARAKVGQDRLAVSLLESFPVDHADGELLEEVREERDAYRERRERAATIVASLRDRTTKLEADVAKEATAAVDEIQRELSLGALDRFATFERVGLDDELPADRAVAIALSGWLQGAASGESNLKLALSALRLRNQIREYVAAPTEPARATILERMRREEAFSVATLASLTASMRPPVVPPPPRSPGLYELEVAGPDGAPIRCLVQLPPEYDPLRRYPAVVTLHASWSTPLNQVEWWAGMPGADGVRQGQAARHGTIVIAPAWAREHQTAYEYSAREHAAVLMSLRAAMRSFSIDTDRVFLTGHSGGGDAAWDIALAHPDLWAGLIAIVPTAGRFVTHYWPNASDLPLYVVGGELDRFRLQQNAVDLDRYFSKGYDVTYVEYRGRGHEHFSDDMLRIFDWMSRKRRNFFPKEFSVVSFRPWDRFFWWLEFEGPPQKTVVLPEQWPPTTGSRPLSIEAKKMVTNTINVRCGAETVRLWLSPDLVDFAQPLAVTIDGQKVHKTAPVADAAVLLEDLRLRSDRQHPFWAVIESTRGQRR
jgi:predicted esterase